MIEFEFESIMSGKWGCWDTTSEDIDRPIFPESPKLTDFDKHYREKESLIDRHFKQFYFNLES